jgi:hypothetical protein
MNNEKIPQVLTMSTLSSEAKKDYIVYTWEKGVDELLSDAERELTPSQQIELLKKKKLAMRKKGDFSYINKGLFQKVYNDTSNKEFVHSYLNKDKEVREFFVYKMINAWGNSFSANEFYKVAKKSVIDNKFLKVDEVSNSAVINAFVADKENKKKVDSAKKPTRVSQLGKKESDKIDKLKAEEKQLEAKMKQGGLGPKEMKKLNQIQKEIAKILKENC